MAERNNEKIGQSRDPQAERTIARICGGAPPPDSHFEALDDQEWQTLEVTAVRTRTANLLHRHLVENRLPVPPTTARRLEQLYRAQTLYGLEQRIVLGQVLRLLQHRHIPGVALKGAALAFSAYPQPAMRPLRDLDILVPANRADEAHAWLRENGFSIADWAGNYGTEYIHQLPELVSPQHEVTVEIHHRIFSRGWDGDAGLGRLLMDTGQSAEISGSTVHLAAPLANMLHLTVHATLHNCFDNGPLTIADVHWLWRDPALDRELLADLADQLELGRPLALLLAVASDVAPIEIPAKLKARVDAASKYVPHALEAMFQLATQTDQRAMVRRLERKHAGAGPLAAMRSMINPTSQKLAELAGVKAGESRRWAAYPSWAWQRGRAYVSALTDRALCDAARRDAQMLDWLRQSD